MKGTLSGLPAARHRRFGGGGTLPGVSGGVWWSIPGRVFRGEQVRLQRVLGQGPQAVEHTLGVQHRAGQLVWTRASAKSGPTASWPRASYRRAMIS